MLVWLKAYRTATQAYAAIIFKQENFIPLLSVNKTLLTVSHTDA